MTEPPSYPKTGSSRARQAPPVKRGRPKTSMILVWVIVGAAFIAMIALHLAGVVGPGTNM